MLKRLYVLIGVINLIVKELLTKFDLNLDIPEIQYTFQVADYKTYEFKTIAGDKCVVFKEIEEGFPLMTIINLDKKNIENYLVRSEDDSTLLCSVDKEGYSPFY